MSAFEAELRDVVAQLVAARDWPASTPQAMNMWEELVSLQLHEVGLPESAGGPGGDLADLVVVVEALAEAAVSVPIIESWVGRWALAVTDTANDAAPAGRVSVGLASDGAAEWDATLNVVVPWGRFAHTVLICTPTEVRAISNTTSLTTHENLAGEPFDSLRLSPAELHAGAKVPLPSGAVRARLALLRSAGLVGAARGALSLTRRHVRQRRQFGAPLLDIPAVASNLARMRVQLVQAQSALARAVATANAEEPDNSRDQDGDNAFEVSAMVGTWTCASSATEIARLAHQLHGAIGTTDEYPLHRLTRRIWAWRDFPYPSHQIAHTLGRLAIEQGEEGTWTALTDWRALHRRIEAHDAAGEG